MSTFHLSPDGELLLEADGAMRHATDACPGCCGGGPGVSCQREPECRQCGACERSIRTLPTFNAATDAYVSLPTNCGCCDLASGEIVIEYQVVRKIEADVVCGYKSGSSNSGTVDVLYRVVGTQVHTSRTVVQAFPVGSDGIGYSVVSVSGTTRWFGKNLRPNTGVSGPCVSYETQQQQDALAAPFSPVLPGEYPVDLGFSPPDNTDWITGAFGSSQIQVPNYDRLPSDPYTVGFVNCSDNTVQMQVTPDLIGHSLTCFDSSFAKTIGFSGPDCLLRNNWPNPDTRQSVTRNISTSAVARYRLTSTINCPGGELPPQGPGPSFPSFLCGTGPDFGTPPVAGPPVDAAWRNLFPTLRHFESGGCAYYIEENATAVPGPGIVTGAFAPSCEAASAGAYATTDCITGQPGPLVDAFVWDALARRGSLPNATVARVDARCYTVDTATRIQGSAVQSAVPLAAFSTCAQCDAGAVFSLSCEGFTLGPKVARTSLNPDRPGDVFEARWPDPEGPLRRWTASTTTATGGPDVFVTEWLENCSSPTATALPPGTQPLGLPVDQILFT